MERFNKLFNEMIGGAGGAFGDFGGEEHGGDVGNTDWYATGDARVPKYIGAKKKSNKKKKKGGQIETEPLVMRRTFPDM